ncbi:magnesium transporter [Patescibacteria group bacterium]|nr:magnesium transporter [Patescibacteria group bacterium]
MVSKKNKINKREKLKIFDDKFKEIFSSQLFVIAGGLISGIILAMYSDKIFIIPGMFIILPGFMAMRGGVSGSFASRLASGLFLKVINPQKINNPIVRGNLVAAFILSLIISLALGLLAFIVDYLFMGVIQPMVIILPFLAGVLSSVILIPLTLIVTFKLFKKGHDPNNIMGPFVTTVGDIVSIFSLLLLSVWLVV